MKVISRGQSSKSNEKPSSSTISIPPPLPMATSEIRRTTSHGDIEGERKASVREFGPRSFSGAQQYSFVNEQERGVISSKTGFLTKRSISSIDAFANWKQRFFVLADGYISYYKQGSGLFSSSKDDIAHLKGEIQLTTDTIARKSNIDDKVNCFEVVTPIKKLYAQAESAADLQEWLTVIRAHVSHIRQEASAEFRRNSLNDIPRAATEDISSRVSSIDFTDRSSHSPIVSTTDQNLLIKQLMEENRRLREQLSMRDNEMQFLEEYQRGTRSSTDRSKPVKKRSSAVTLDLRDVRRKQFELWDHAEEGNLSAVTNLLQEAVVDINGKGIDQWTALHLAICHNHPTVAKTLITRGALVNCRTRERLTPLHIACRRGYVDCAQLLLASGADCSLTDLYGNTCMHSAAEGGHIEIVKLLIANGTATNVTNASGSFPIHLSPIGHPIRVLLSSREGSGAELAQRLPIRSSGCFSRAPKLASSPLGVSNEETESSLQEETGNEFRNEYYEDLVLGPQDFEFIKVLGRGAFAKVYLVRGKGTNRNKWFALKAYNKQAILQKNQARYILTEKAALQACSNHPFIVTLHFSFQSQDRLFLVMDYCAGGDLLSALTKRKSFTEAEACFYIAEIVLALSHLHSKNIVFRDLKPENVVLDSEGHALLTDFGISKEGINDHCSANTFCGSPMYLAPEMLSRTGHGHPLDWYSVGALLYELLTGLPPYYTNDKKQLFHNILKGNLPIPEYFSPAARDILQQLLHRDPVKRLGSKPQGAKEIMNHPFFRTIDWTALYNRKIPPPFKPQIHNTANGIPDISNFPQAFTDQVISNIEKGVDSNIPRIQNRDDGKLFRDFDFQPAYALSPEAVEFERMALGAKKGEMNTLSSTLSENDDSTTEL